MTTKEALRRMRICCEIIIGKLNKSWAFRNISNEFCKNYEQVEKEIKKLEYIESIEKKYTISAVACMELLEEKAQAIGNLQERKEDIREW